MIRLAIIFFLISMIESEKCVFSIGELKTIRKLYNDSEHHMEEATQGQSRNAVIVIGAARCGKSTLINYLMGNELEAYKYGVSRYAGLKIKQVNENMPGPEIAVGPASKTSIPSKWNSKRPELQNLDIWDSAGFDDNRGPMQDLSNSFHLYHLTRKVENLKFILVIDFNDIQRDGTTPIENVLSILEKYFTDKYRTFYPSVSVIITKAATIDDLNNAIDNEYIYYKLRDKLLSNTKLAIRNVSKDFIQHIIDNNQSFAIFRAAEKKGNLPSDIDVNIIPAIKSSKRIIKSCHQDIGVPISADSEKCLQKSNDALLPIDAFAVLTFRLTQSFNKNFDAACQSNVISTLQTNKAELNRIYENLNTSLINNPDAEVKVQVLEMISDDFKNIIEDEDVLNKISLTRFVDFILRIDKMSKINTAVNGLIEPFKAQTRSLVTLCLRQLKEITNNEYIRRQKKDNENKEHVLKNANDTISKLKLTQEEMSWWEQFLNTIARFLQLDDASMKRKKSLG